MTDWNTCPAVERDPRKISGAWAFTGTRVPVYALGPVAAVTWGAAETPFN